MKLFVFTPNETGFYSFYVMSETEEEALKSLNKLKEFDMADWDNYSHIYTIKFYDVNEPTCIDNQ